MADVFGMKDLGVKDTSPLKTGDTRRAYNKDSCIANHMSKGKTKAEATALCKKQ